MWWGRHVQTEGQAVKEEYPQSDRDYSDTAERKGRDTWKGRWCEEKGSENNQVQEYFSLSKG